MKLFAFEARDGNCIKTNVDVSEISQDSDVVSGVMVNLNSESVYVIEKSIAILLADNDIDPIYLQKTIGSILDKIPDAYKNIAVRHLQRSRNRKPTSIGKWNAEEMEYYDSGVENEVKRKVMVKEIWEEPNWRLFIPREKYIIGSIRSICNEKTVLEIGSGNSRTIANIFRPKDNNYFYVGSDISFNRLLVAKAAIPEGDFIQANAMNLPLLADSFSVIISFGMLHHLPDSNAAIAECVRILKENGLLCFHEPITKPKILRNKQSRLRRILSIYQHSEHDNDLHLPSIVQALRENQMKVVFLKYFNTVVKSFIEFVLQKATSKMIYMSKMVVRILLFVDRCMIFTICQIWKGFGPHSVIMVSRKNKR